MWLFGGYFFEKNEASSNSDAVVDQMVDFQSLVLKLMALYILFLYLLLLFLTDRGQVQIFTNSQTPFYSIYMERFIYLAILFTKFV